MFKNPIVAFDGSEPSRRALEAGIELAAALGVGLTVVVVEEGAAPTLQVEALAATDVRVVQEIAEAENDWRRRLVDQARALVEAANVSVMVETVSGDEVGAIADAVRRHACDLLIVGLRHHSGLLERLVPHTAQSLTERVPCSVLGVR